MTRRAVCFSFLPHNGLLSQIDCVASHRSASKRTPIIHSFQKAELADKVDRMRSTSGFPYLALRCSKKVKICVASEQMLWLSDAKNDDSS